jgi:RNA polymerase sigma-70 factor (ECF subfamily)
MLNDLNDIELVRLFKEDKNKEQVFTTIVKRYQERIYWQIRRLVVSHTDADDVMQNVFIKAWNALDQFREDAKLFTWLYRIATNESLTFLDQAKRRSSVSFDDVSETLERKKQSGSFS